jgi:chromosome segregation ATPase
MSKVHHWLAVTGCAVTLAGGCSNQKPAPLYASSADQGGYATRYPVELGAARGNIGEQESRARRLMAEFETYPNALNKPNWSQVQRVVELADQAGRSEEYAQSYEESQQVNGFFADEGPEIRRKVAGSVQWVAKDDSCKEPAKFGGAATHALDTAVERAQRDRLRAHNEAQRYIELYKESLGTKNAELLSEQADTIAETSYAVYVGIERNRRQMEQMVSESSNVRSTLEDQVKDLNARAADQAAPAKDRQTAQKQAEEAQTALDRLQSEQQQAEYVLKEMDKRQEQLQKDYKAALDKLLERIEQMSKTAGAT